ncbi:hypothetical protein QYM36_013262, partial [Artemia franciscana]
VLWQRKGGTYWVRYIHLEILGSGGSRREQRAQRNERASLAGQRENSELSIEERVQVLPSSDQWESLSSSALVTGEGVVDASAVTKKLVRKPGFIHRRPDRNRAKIRQQSTGLITDWTVCVKNLTVSSREAWANRLIDGTSSFWQSCGVQGKHWIRLEMNADILISSLKLHVDQADSSYTPSLIVVFAGESLGTLKEVNVVTVGTQDSWITLMSDAKHWYKYVEICMKQCRNGGIDCKIHGLSIVGRFGSIKDDLMTMATYLASDNEEYEKNGAEISQRLKLLSSARPQTEKSSCKAFVWGLNDKDQLGGLKGSKIKTPVFSETISSLNPVSIAGGSKSLFVITEDGKVFACGEGTSGRLGLGFSVNVSSPKQIMGLSKYFVKKVAVHSGGRHALALTADGKVFAWGEGEDGKLGLGTEDTHESPQLVESLITKRVRDVACGSSHSAAVTSEGELYTWGFGEYGRLGHGDNKTYWKPKLVEALRSKRVVQVSCGSRDAQTLCLTEDGMAYSWGDGDFGKLGRGGSEGCALPMNIDRLNGLGVCHIECGAQFSLALTNAGQVWTWGKGDYYRLGHGSEQHVRKPTVVETLRGEKVVSVAVGALHCIAVTDSGQVYAWGDNDHGQQGNGCTAVNKKPSPVLGLDGAHVSKVACGSSHSIAWTCKESGLISPLEPIPFSVSKDPLGASHIGGPLENWSDLNSVDNSLKTPAVVQQFSLARLLMSLSSVSSQQQALDHIVGALQVVLSRRAVAAVLESQVEVGKPQDEFETESILSGERDCLKLDFGEGKLEEAEVARNLVVPHNEIEESPECAPELVNVLNLRDVRLLLDLLKLSVAGRLQKPEKNIIISALIGFASTDAEISAMILEFCLTELENVALDLDPLKRQPSPVVQESPHPYNDDCTLVGHVIIPGAEALRIEFDHQCSTERRHDTLTITDGSGRIATLRSGRDWSCWSNELRIPGNELRWRFNSDGSINGWGWKFTVFPVLPSSGMDASISSGSLSDRSVMARPSVGFVASLLDPLLETILESFEKRSEPKPYNKDLNGLLRLCVALAACAQRASLSADNRMWALHRLKKILSSPFGSFMNMTSLVVNSTEGEDPCDSSREASQSPTHSRSNSPVSLIPSTNSTNCSALSPTLDPDSSINSLVRSLPDVILRQYEFEEPLVRHGKQLMHSQFFKVLIGLGCDMNLDSSPVCSDSQKWNWFKRRPEDWTLTYGATGTIYGWGHNHRGQLGGVECSKVKIPAPCDTFTALRPVQIVGGEQTLFAVTADGKVHATGYGAGGRLGIGGSESVTQPTLLESIQQVFIKKVAVNSGGKHCLILSSEGEVYSFGEADDGKLGHGNKFSCDKPKVIEALRGKEIIDIACGGAHSAAVSAVGELYTWGKGRYGRLGHGDSEDQLKPKLVEALIGYRVVGVACGSGDAQTLCITDDDSVWSWGDGDYGKLGRGGSDGCK